MMFFKVEGLLANDRNECEENRRKLLERNRHLLSRATTFNDQHREDGYCFVAQCKDGQLVAGIISQNPAGIQGLSEAFLESIGCPLQDITIAETTIHGIEQLLTRACRTDLVEDYHEIIAKYGLDRVLGQRGRGIEFGENLVKNACREEIVREAEKRLLGKTFLPELDRIYAGTAYRNIQGHPVHYMLQVDNPDTRREGCQLLLQALYNNDRLSSRRYCFLNFRPGEDFSTMAFNSLYQLCDGGAVVIRYYANDDSEAYDVASSERVTIERICEIVKAHRHHTLTILCLPRECTHTRKLFFENLGAMTFVQLQEDTASGQEAQDFLKQLAKSHHVRPDKRLFEKLDAEQSYLASGLQDLFDQWYDAKLKTTLYPQYKNLTAAKKEIVKASPKGSAYDELQEMIGLSDAKAVICKALNYYKMQKLCEDKGVPTDTPAMHMVFTGNPGTAKTTAARLFARIMKDNGLLSRGQLVEVGRGDLVGRFVGWTAQTVQEKFRAAKGGVLFIDEAYSLVDDRGGSFGDEAINTIVQEMENHREDMVVIFAGYPREMENFLQRNPGLRSRIAFHVPFADYSTEELCSIAQLMGRRKGIRFEDAALEQLQAVFRAARQQGDFGNGRYVRNILEQAKMNQASRLLEYAFEYITPEEIRTIKAVDLPAPELQLPEKRAIGFAS